MASAQSLLDEFSSGGDPLLDSLSEARKNFVRQFLYDMGITQNTEVKSEAYSYDRFVDSLVIFINSIFAGTPKRFEREFKKTLGMREPVRELGTEATPPQIPAVDPAQIGVTAPIQVSSRPVTPAAPPRNAPVSRRRR